MPKRIHNRHPLYNRWSLIKRRCKSPSCPAYKDYGGRGIDLCKEWEKFENFAKDMAPTYHAGLTLDRIDNNKGYYKENCRWATRQQQALNTRNIDRAYKIEYMGISDTITNWANYLGMKRRTLGMRLMNYGWSIEKSLNEGRSAPSQT